MHVAAEGDDADGGSPSDQANGVPSWTAVQGQCMGAANLGVHITTGRERSIWVRRGLIL